MIKRYFQFLKNDSRKTSDFIYKLHMMKIVIEYLILRNRFNFLCLAEYRYGC